MPRIVRQCFIVACKRLREAIAGETGVAEVIESFRMARRQRQRVAILRDGLFETARAIQRKAEVRHGVERRSIGLHRLGEKADRLEMTAALEMDVSEQVQRVEMIAAIFQYR